VAGSPILPFGPVDRAAPPLANVPILFGSNRSEFRTFVAGQVRDRGAEFATEDYQSLLGDLFGANAETVVAGYPLSDFGDDVASAYATAGTDGVFACPSNELARRTTQPVFGYEFDDPTAPLPPGAGTPAIDIGAGHGQELQYLFDREGVAALTSSQLARSDRMIGYWAEFVATGQPGRGGTTDSPQWPDVRGGARMTFESGGPRVTTDFDAVHRCGLWATVS
jgi:para-nitrobenzyl esterase